jgi:hypothetical protein
MAAVRVGRQPAESEKTQLILKTASVFRLRRDAQAPVHVR